MSSGKRWSDKLVDAKLGPSKKQPRIQDRRVKVDGRTYGSRLEETRHQELLWLEKAGKVRDIECQARVELTDARIAYIADFRYFDLELGETVYDETKGQEGDRWKVVRKLWHCYGPARLRIFKGVYRNRESIPVLEEEIVPPAVLNAPIPFADPRQVDLEDLIKEQTKGGE